MALILILTRVRREWDEGADTSPITSDARYMGTLHFQLFLHIVYSCFHFFLLHVDHIWTPTHFIFISPKLHFLLKLLQIKQKEECLCTLYNKRIIHGGTSWRCKETRLLYTSHWTKSLGEEKRPWKYRLQLGLIVHRFPHIYKDLPDIFQQLWNKSYWWSN